MEKCKLLSDTYIQDILKPAKTTYYKKVKN